MNDNSSDVHMLTCSDDDTLLSTSALSCLVQRAIKIIFNQDGLHGVYRRLCDAESLVGRAQKQRFLLLDLGHVVRMYFGDDYYDVLLESDVLHERSETLDSIVSAVSREAEQNALAD